MIFSAERGSSHDSAAKHCSLCPGEEKTKQQKQTKQTKKTLQHLGSKELQKTIEVMTKTCNHTPQLRNVAVLKSTLHF